MKYTFDCGCQIPILNEQKKSYDGLPSMVIPYDDIVYKLNYGEYCDKVWEVFKYGNTKGVFQLEKNLGQGWSKKLQPQNVSELAALISILRPGSLRAIDPNSGKSMSQKYVDRKHEVEPITYLHSALEEYLGDTYGVFVYQEQAIKIAQGIAGFDLQEADQLRKSIGKKDTKLMSELESKFSDGCKQTKIVDKEQADQIFNWIRESQRYSFNACLCPTTTFVETENGHKTLDEIIVGEKIKSGENEFTTVVDKYENGTKEVFQVVLESGRSIDCTMEHEFMNRDGIKRKLSDMLWMGIPMMVVHNSRTYYESIICIISMGQKRVVDIEVDNESHCFLANGILTSNSHATGYAFISYLCAWVKYHLPIHFFCSWIGLAHEKQEPKEELLELVYNAREMKLDILTPSIFKMDNEWSSIENGAIRVGVLNVSGVGGAQLKKLKQTIDDAEATLNKRLADFTWLEFILFIADMVSEPTIAGLISVGAIGIDGMSRNRMLHEFKCSRLLNEREKKWMRNNIHRYDTLEGAIKVATESVGTGRAFFNDKRKANGESILMALQEPAMSLEDTARWVISTESELLGVPISMTKVDEACSVEADTTCQEFKDGKPGNNFNFVVEIVSTRPYSIKNGEQKGRKMCYLKIADKSASIDGVIIFPDTYEQVAGEIYVGNVIALSGYRSSRDNGLIVKNTYAV